MRNSCDHDHSYRTVTYRILKKALELPVEAPRALARGLCRGPSAQRLAPGWGDEHIPFPSQQSNTCIQAYVCAVASLFCCRPCCPSLRKTAFKCILGAFRLRNHICPAHVSWERNWASGVHNIYLNMSTITCRYMPCFGKLLVCQRSKLHEFQLQYFINCH